MKTEEYIKRVAIAILVMDLVVVGYKKTKSSPETRKVEVSITQEKSPEIKQEIYSFRIEGFDEKKKVQWNLEGESANVISDKINVKNLKGTYYGDEGMTFTIFADMAVYNKKTQDIELKDNIVGKTSDGGELVTDYARWNAKREEITTDSYIIIKRQNIMCRGRGAVTKPRLKWIVFKSHIEVDIAPDKKITCRGPFEIDHGKNMAVFNNNVKIRDTNTETHTDRLTVYLNPDTNMVERIVTEGNVEVVHKGGKIEDIGEVSF